MDNPLDTHSTSTQDSPDILPDTELSDNLDNTDVIITKTSEFLDFFTGFASPALFKCQSKTQNRALNYLLITLKKQIKQVVEKLNTPKNSNENYQFLCTQCNEPIIIDPGKDMWENLTNHAHFEEMFCDFITHKSSNRSTSESNADSGIDQLENEDDAHIIQDSDSSHSEIEEEDGDNSFRFNFTEHYDDVIENKIYPHNIINSVRKIDQIKENTIQRAGKGITICLICPCEMKMKGTCKLNIVSHALGQRHIKAANNPSNVSALEKYHDIFLREKPEVQAHQVYVRPVDSSPDYKCMLCNTRLTHENVIPHLVNDTHRKKVMDMFLKGSSPYFLLNLQVKLYGLDDQQINEFLNRRDEENRKKSPKKENKEKKGGPSESDIDEGGDKPDTSSQHNIVKAIEDPSTIDQLQLLPHRYRGHLEFIKQYEVNDACIIKCELCKVTLLENVGIIMSHIRQNVHQRLSNLNWKNYTYFCDVCEIHFRTEDSWIKHFQKLQPKHKKANVSKLLEYECVSCKAVIYGDEYSTKKHCNPGLRNRRAKSEKEIKLPQEIKNMFKSSEFIIKTATELLNNAEQVLKDNVTDNCCKRMHNVLSMELFGPCMIHPFGSRISGIGDKDSDLDVFVDVGDMYTGLYYQDQLSQSNIIHRADKAFSRHNKEFKILARVITARTPIIKIHHLPTDLECDLSFRHGLSVENTKFLRYCFKLQPITQQLVIIIKKWASYINTDTFTTYSLAMMVIFYLQVKGYLLSVKKIREINGVACPKIGGWEALVYKVPIDIQPYPNNIVQLLKEFFDYYSKFNYNEDVICPLLGETIKKSLFSEQDGKKLPKDMKLYVQQLKSDEAEHFRVLSPLCVQDPFDLSHNLTKACQLGAVNKLKAVCELSLKHLIELN